MGRKLKGSKPSKTQLFNQKRLYCFFSKGFLFYAEYNIRLLIYLLFRKVNLICAIDLDTIIPCYFISVIKSVPWVYDAHELFCEMKEIVTRPLIYKCWKFIERRFAPKFKDGYTVNKTIADEFKKMYALDYEVIRNMPVSIDLPEIIKEEKYILYQVRLMREDVLKR